ncbi:MAG: DUF3108 domain-containing protein [Bacteroidota bacterium]
MKKFLFYCIEIPIFILFQSFSWGQTSLYTGDGLRNHTNEAFQRGEALKYRVHYGWIDAGEAILKVTYENKKIKNRNTYHIVGTGRTLNVFNWFFKVKDRYETYIDEEALVPWIFIRRVDEGGYIINQDQIYDHYNNTVNSNGKILEVPDGIQDMLSVYYFGRCVDLSGSKPGDVFTFLTFVDNEIFTLKVKYMGKEKVENNLGTFNCVKFHPVIQEGRVFNAEKDLSIWLSDDKNHIPIRLEAKLFVGSVRMDLKSYSGLVNPIAIVEE